ncbi:MAG: hypothetical protein HDT28_01525 [Clostridiales bacterium]|nr:hypothetical protein [Clostridiales bacterium]
MATNYINGEYIEALRDSSFRLTAERLVMNIGVRAYLKGFNCIADAVILYGTELCSRFCDIYDVIAEYRSVSHKSVMREIAYALSSEAEEIAKNLSAMTGANITKLEVHSGLVIAYLGKLFRAPEAAVYG